MRQSAYETPFMAPPLSTQTMFFASDTATDTGNSPPEQTGLPTILRFVGLLGLIFSIDTVFEPAYKPRIGNELP